MEETKKENPKKPRRTLIIVFSCFIGLSLIGTLVIVGLYIGAIFSSGYNDVMYKSLSDPTCYKSSIVLVDTITSYDHKTVVQEFPKDIPDNVDLVEIEGRYDTTLSNENQLRVKVIGENISVLLQNGFFKDFVPKDYIEIQYSNFIYMDTQYYYVASLSYQKKEYISFEVGLKNIITLMDNNRSFL